MKTETTVAGFVVLCALVGSCGGSDRVGGDAGPLRIDLGPAGRDAGGPTSCADLPFTYTTSLRRQHLCMYDLDTCAFELADVEAGGCSEGGVTWFWSESGDFVEVTVVTPSAIATDRRVPWDFVSTSTGNLGTSPPSLALAGIPRGGGLSSASFVVRTGAHDRYEVVYSFDGSATLTIESVTRVATDADCPGAPRGVTCTRNGAPGWDTAGWTIFAAPDEAAARAVSVVPMHSYYTDPTGFQVIGPNPAQPHAPPYGAELSAGVDAAGFVLSNSFTTAQLTAPASVYFMYLVAPHDDAPRGMTSDFADGPIFASAWEPLLSDGQLSRDGVILDPEFDVPYPQYSMVPVPGDGYSHMVVAWWENSNYISVAPGAHELYFHLLDNTLNGWDIVMPFTVL